LGASSVWAANEQQSNNDNVVLMYFIEENNVVWSIMNNIGGTRVFMAGRWVHSCRNALRGKYMGIGFNFCK
jgi:hypothetical protein